ncbi:MAG: galactokinase [Bdellovibrionia bacterium]
MKTVIASAPGRVNLIGEHTDYNAGFVLPTPIPQSTRVQLRVRNDRIISLRSSLSPEASQGMQYELESEKPGRGWIDYVQGVTHILRAEGFPISGFDIRIDSDVPVGSGLSSSAALEVALMRAIREAFALNLDDVTIAKLGQRVENEFVGARVGIMDQMASSVGRPGEALFLDCRDLSYRRVPLPFKKLDLVVIHSGVSHGHAGGEYNTRRAQCEEACRTLGVQSLRELSEADIPRMESLLTERLLRRARHVVTENARVLRAVAAIESGDAEQLGQLFYASHNSMRDDYEVTVPEIDLLVQLASQDSEVFGARMTGGGFGGSVVVLTHPKRGQEVARRIVSSYDAATGRSGLALVS